jgi:hypothetical protein
LLAWLSVQIELTSTLTREDENRLAPAVMKALSGVLDMLPIAYILRVETTDENILVHVSPQPAAWESVPVTTVDAIRPVLES